MQLIVRDPSYTDRLAAFLTSVGRHAVVGAPDRVDIWDRRLCRHPEGVACSGKLGCKVLARAAELWNEHSKAWWRELNRVAKQRADRSVRRLGHNYRGGLLVYEWELQSRGLWHLHFVLGMETAVERVWAFEYVKALRELGPSKGFGYVDAKPLHSPQLGRRFPG